MLEEDINDARVAVFGRQMKRCIRGQVELVHECVEFALFEEILYDVVVAAATRQMKACIAVAVFGIQYLFDRNTRIV